MTNHETVAEAAVEEGGWDVSVPMFSRTSWQKMPVPALKEPYFLAKTLSCDGLQYNDIAMSCPRINPGTCG